MLPVLTWIDKHTEEDDIENGSCIYDLAFKPDGTQLLVAIGRRVIVYDPDDGSVIISLKAHKSLVYAVAFAFNGERYASGSLDKTVIVWSDRHEGLLKFLHNDSVQCLAFSPTAMTLISCAAEDYGIWMQNEKNVSKQRVASRCTSCQWSNDGTHFAIGFFDGTVSIRCIVGSSTPIGEEVCKIERPGKEPVWALQFAPICTNNVMQGEMLVVADWNQSVGFYNYESGQVIHKVDRLLDYDPTAVHLFSNGCFFLTTGSNKKLNLHTKEGNDLGTMAQLDAWPWCMAFRQKRYCVVVGCIDGSLACYQLMLNTVHALHRDRYAFRENQTDVVVQQLHRQNSTRIRCNDLVRKVAIYNNRLAASGDKDGEQLDYRLLDRINQCFDCSLLVVCTHHVILCQDHRLTCYDLKGIKQREWLMESLIRYIKVVGGPPGRETILVGMRGGVVSKIFVDNPFPVEVIRLKSMIRCVDISVSKRKLATVDEDGVCVVYDTHTHEILNQEPDVSSVAFNCENEDLICYSGNGMLHIKSHCFTPYQQKLEPSHQGFVVGFMGKRVYILHMYSMQCLEIPLTSQLLQLLDHKMFKEAYALACLGITERDWRMLGEEALDHMEFTIAKKAFYRIHDCRSLMLINELEEMQLRGTAPEEMRALIFTHNRRFRQAVQLFQTINAEHKALEMFADLRMFDQAQDLLFNSSAETQRQLMRKKAEWAQSTNDWTTAAELRMACGDYAAALRIMIDHDWLDRVMNAARKLDHRTDAALLREIGNYLADRREFAAATAVFTRIHDQRSIVRMHVNAHHWEDALAIVERNDSLSADVYLPYARWLAERDRFDDAQLAYNKAGAEAEASQVLHALCENAVRETRFQDASYYYRIMAAQLLRQIGTENKPNGGTVVSDSEALMNVSRWRELVNLADVYFTYDTIFKYMVQPFTDKPLDVLFNMARFVAIHANARPPNRPIECLSKATVLFTLVKLSDKYANYKTARQVLEQLRALRPPPHHQPLIDVLTLETRAKPFADAEEFQPMCYSCGTSNPILGGHRCVHCDAEFVYSFNTFEVLPVVEVMLEEGVDDQEAMDLLNAEPPSAFNIERIAMNKRKTASASGSDNLTRLSRDDLHNLDRALVFVCNYRPPHVPNRYFVKVIEEINISKCEHCQRMFHADDYQMAILQTAACPVCRAKVDATRHSAWATATSYMDDPE